MRIPVLIALIGATAMISATANAQDRHDRSDRGGSHTQADAHGGQRGNDHAAPARAGGNGQRPAYTPQASAARPDFNRAPAGRPDAHFNGQQGDYRQAPAVQRGAYADRGNRSEAYGQYRPDARGQRDDGYRAGNNYGDRGYQRDQANRGSGYNNRETYNRNWRGDNRYDWRDYRARNRDAYRLPRYYSPYGWNYGYRRFGIGVTLNSVLFGENYWIDDPYDYRLPPAYGPYRWVRYYNDALLVDIRTGYVVDTVYDIFW